MMMNSYLILTSFCLAVATHYLLYIGKIYLIAPLIGHDELKINSITKTIYLLLLASAMFGYTLNVFGFSWHGWLAILLCCGLFILAMMDWDYWLLPDQVTLSLLWLGLLSNCYQGFTTCQAAILGACAGYLSFWLIGWLFQRATGRLGMGYGDYKLLAAIGAWLGWHLLTTIVSLATLLALTTRIYQAIWQKNKPSAYQPFGTYLALATWLVLIN